MMPFNLQDYFYYPIYQNLSAHAYPQSVSV